MTTPSYEVFVEHQRRKTNSISNLLRHLVAGEPVNLTEHFPHLTRSKQVAPQAFRIQKEGGCRISLRVVDGNLWACRLRDEDVIS